MKGKASVLIVLLIFFKSAGIVVAQSASDFEKKFEEFSKSGFDSLEAKQLLNTYFSLLTPFNQVNQLGIGMKGEQWQQFPLESFKSDLVYVEHIDKLIESPVPDVRLLGYLTIASTGDKTKNTRLSEKLNTELSPNCSLWLGMTLMSLGFDRTSSLFPWMVKNNGEAGGYLFPMFTSLPTDSLRETAYQFVESDDWNEQVYAIQLLINTKFSKNTDKIVRNAISTWPLHLKGYAIVPAQKLRLGNLLPLLAPLLDSSRTRKASLQALADSPTEADRKFVIKLSDQSMPSDKDVMASMQSSRYPEVVKHWILKLENNEVPSDYYFSVYQDTLLKSDELLPAVRNCLSNAQNSKIVSSLLPVLSGRTDDASQKILLNLIRSTNSSLRESASKTLIGTCTDSLKNVLPQVARDSSLCTSFTFDLIMGCGLDTLQNTADYIYSSKVEYTTKLNALKYLTTFPENRHLTLFRALINNGDDDYMFKRMLAKGLAQLNDLASVESIIRVSERERKGSDWNSISYIEALSRLKVDASRVYISSFLSSKEEDVKKVATKIIDSW